MADVDGLLLLLSNGRHPAAPNAVPNPTGNGLHTATVYIGTDLDDAGGPALSRCAPPGFCSHPATTSRSPR